MNSVTYDVTQSFPGPLVGNAIESAATDDNLTVQYSIQLTSNGNMTLTAGDNVLMQGSLFARQNGTVSIAAGVGDTDGIGAIQLDGYVTAIAIRLAALQSISMSGLYTASLVDISAGAGVRQVAGQINADRLQSQGNVRGDVILTSNNAIRGIGDLTVFGNFTLTDNDLSALTLIIDGNVSAENITIVNANPGGEIEHTGRTNVQHLQVDAGNQGFTLSFNRQVTTSLSAASTAADIEAALNSLFAVRNRGGVTVTGSNGDYTITFGPSNLSGHLELIHANANPGSSVVVSPGADTTISGHEVKLIADHIALTSGPITATDTIFLAPATSGTEVAIGDGATAPFALGQTELDKLSAPTLTIGADSAGTVTAGRIQIGSATISSHTLNLLTQGEIVQVGALQVDGGNGTVNVTAGDRVFLASARIGAIGGSAGSHFVVADLAPSLAVNAIKTSGGEIVLLCTGALSIDGPLTSDDAKVLLLAGTRQVIQGDVDAGSAAIGISLAQGDVRQSAGKLTGTDLIVNSLSGSGSIMLDSVGNAVAGRVALHAGATGGDISFTNASAYMIGGGGDIFAASASVTIALLPGGAIVTAPSGTVTLTAGGDITQAGTFHERIATGTLNLARLGGANPNITLDNADNAISNLGSVDLGSGALTLVDSVDLTLTGSLGVGLVDLTAPSVTLASGSHLVIELGGTVPGQYDQVHVHGTVDLGGATLDASLLNGFAPAANASFIIIDNDGTDAVTGTFAGLAEGALLNIGGTLFTTSYHGGDGNDVTLTTLANHAPVNTVPGPQSVTTGTDLAIAGLSVADQDAGSGMMTTLSFTHGTLHLAAGHAALAGNDSASVTLTGTLAEIDATLAANVTYRAQAGFTGSDTLTITTSDNGNSGLGGPLADSDSVKIDVNAVVHVPPVPVTGTDGDDSFTAPGSDSAFIGKRGVDSITFGFKLIDATVTYSGNDIIIDGPNGTSHTVVTGIETFVFTDGTVNNRDGNPLVDDLFYYARNHDVWNAHVDADAHFATFGWREGRDPNAWFDTKGYLAQYADVKAAGVNPLTHYDQNGWREGRDPSTAFDTGDYLSHNTDVAAAHVDPLAHFLTWGSEEGRTPFNDGMWS
jgi:hypothetical protein